MSHKLAKTGAVACALALSVSMFGCAATSKTPEGPAATSASVQARTSDEIATTAATLDKQSDNDTMGGKETKTVSLGQQVTGDGYTFTLTNYQYEKAITLGSDAAEHQEEPGRQYLVVSGTFTNTSNTAENIRKGTAAWFTFDGVFEDAPSGEYGIQGWTDAIDDSGVNFSNYIVQPGETVQFFVYAEIEDTVASGATGANLLWGFNETLDDAHYEASTEALAYSIKLY